MQNFLFWYAVLALINNVFEIRLDAYKYTTQLRRPIGDQARDIGIWHNILHFITYMAVFSNVSIEGAAISAKE